LLSYTSQHRALCSLIVSLAQQSAFLLSPQPPTAGTTCSPPRATRPLWIWRRLLARTSVAPFSSCLSYTSVLFYNVLFSFQQLLAGRSPLRAFFLFSALSAVPRSPFAPCHIYMIFQGTLRAKYSLEGGYHNGQRQLFIIFPRAVLPPRIICSHPHPENYLGSNEIFPSLAAAFSLPPPLSHLSLFLPLPPPHSASHISDIPGPPIPRLYCKLHFFLLPSPEIVDKLSSPVQKLWALSPS